jgi:hypothetical protein
MDEDRFDTIIRLLTATGSRRALAAVLSSLVTFGALPTDAKKRHKKKKPKKPKLNAFGCLNVGQPCRGKDAKCCSGICQGKKPKPGERDKSRCVGHDATSCVPGQTSCDGTGRFVPCTTSAGQGGDCYTTTGNAAFCSTSTACVSCRTDADCRPFCGPQAACTPCAGCDQTGGTACSGIGECVFPT